jgi:hypothetical protein
LSPSGFPFLLFRSVVAAALLALAGVAAGADGLVTRDGRQLEGAVTDNGGTVTIDLESGSRLTFLKSEVKQVTYAAVDRQTFAERFEKVAADDAKGFVELGRWARDRKMPAEALRAFRRAAAAAGLGAAEGRMELAALYESQGELRRAYDAYTVLAAAKDKAAEEKQKALAARMDADRAAAWARAATERARGRFERESAELRSAQRAMRPGAEKPGLDDLAAAQA